MSVFYPADILAFAMCSSLSRLKFLASIAKPQGEFCRQAVTVKHMLFKVKHQGSIRNKYNKKSSRGGPLGAPVKPYLTRADQ
jgi:hypothetical protein